ncbi:hypothetical protein N9427_02445 [Paracoccaceae bacterium]|nr:hypothetical protein [Paracoccaceae bacterium]
MMFDLFYFGSLGENFIEVTAQAGMVLSFNILPRACPIPDGFDTLPNTTGGLSLG